MLLNLLRAKSGKSDGPCPGLARRRPSRPRPHQMGDGIGGWGTRSWSANPHDPKNDFVELTPKAGMALRRYFRDVGERQ